MNVWKVSSRGFCSFSSSWQNAARIGFAVLTVGAARLRVEKHWHPTNSSDSEFHSVVQGLMKVSKALMTPRWIFIDFSEKDVMVL